MTLPPATPPPRGPAPHVPTALRYARTRKLLQAAADATDPGERVELLGQVAVLNVDVADAIALGMAARYGSLPAERADALRRAREAYVQAVLAREPSPDADLLAQLAPVVRDAVLAVLRAHPPHRWGPPSPDPASTPVPGAPTARP